MYLYIYTNKKGDAVKKAAQQVENQAQILRTQLNNQRNVLYKYNNL